MTTPTPTTTTTYAIIIWNALQNAADKINLRTYLGVTWI